MSEQQQDGFNPEHFSSAARSQKEFLKQYVPEDDDEGVIAHFRREREFKPFRTQQAGEDVYEDVDFVHIVVRGNDKLEVDRPATDADKRRFPFAWQQYQAGKEQAARGTPLDELGIPASVIAAYHAKNVFTVEDLAKVSDGNLQSLPSGARDARHRARERVELKKQAQASGEAEALRKQNVEILAKNAELEKNLNRAMSALERMEKRLDEQEASEEGASEKPSKRGRQSS